MNSKSLLLLLLIIIASSCSKDKDEIIPELDLSEFEIDVIDYFKAIALGFEFGNVSRITLKWNSGIKIFIGGQPNSELTNELETIMSEINELTTDGINISVVNDSLQSNYYIFFGSGARYADIYPSISTLISSNWGLFTVYGLRFTVYGLRK